MESHFIIQETFFLCLYLFSIYILDIFFIENKNIKNLVLFSIFTALLLNTKILGIIPIFLFLFFYIYNFLNSSKKLLKEKKLFIYFFLITIVSIYILWPYLWSNPITNLYYAFINILKAHESLVVINFYFGDYIQSDMTPWHYRTRMVFNYNTFNNNFIIFDRSYFSMFYYTKNFK